MGVMLMIGILMSVHIHTYTNPSNCHSRKFKNSYTLKITGASFAASRPSPCPTASMLTLHCRFSLLITTTESEVPFHLSNCSSIVEVENDMDHADGWDTPHNMYAGQRIFGDVSML